MSHQKIYKGVKKDGNFIVTVNNKPLRVVEYHADSFAWGYGGSGPATLALSILANYFGETWVNRKYLMHHKIGHDFPRCWLYHQDFKERFVARWNINGSWELSSETIAAWINEVKA